MARTQEVTKQSRTGKRPIKVPQGVQVTVEGRTVRVKGPKGELAREIPAEVELQRNDDELLVTPKKGTGIKGLQYQGLARALVHNMVQGTSEGYKVSLDFRGVGYRATVNGDNFEMVVGLSHGVTLPIPAGLNIKVETIDSAGTKFPRVHLESTNKEQLGQFAARVRSVRPPEPYKGKGVRYLGEKVREKAGKAGKAGK
ncbi:MAG: 50S ribosomal protein L6 [Myxococcota bacterium]